MTGHTLQQLIDIEQVRSLLESHHRLSGMACGLMANNAAILVAAGLQEICTRYHWNNPAAFARCWRNDPETRTELHEFEGDIFECRCKNGMINIAMPVVIEGRRLAIFFAGQFFYDDEPPDRDYFVTQAEELGMDSKAYLDALDRAPVFSREHVRNNMLFLHNMVQIMAEMGHNKLNLMLEMKEHEQTGHQLKLLGFALDNVHEAAFLIDVKGRFLLVNQEACRSLGYTREELLGMGIPDVDPEFIPERMAESFSDLFKRGTHTFESWHCTRDARTFPVEITSTVLKHNGTRYILSLARDITERKRTEELLKAREREFRLLAENSPDNIVRYDANCRMIYVNPRMEKTLGLPAAVLLGKTPVEKPPGEERIEYMKRIMLVLATGEEAEIDIVLPDAGNGKRHHNIRFVAERGPEGRVTGVLAIGRDITERKRAEQEIHEKQQRLHDMALELSMSEERERYRIATELHDTLGQDLTLARLRLGLFAKSGIPDEHTRMLDAIREPLEAAISRVRSMIRLTTSPPILESAGLEAALKWLGRQMETEYALRVEFTDDLLDKTLPRAHQTEIYNTVRELLINVVKHADTDNAGLSVSREEGSFVVTVEDHGKGYRADVNAAAAKGGFGLFNIRRRLVCLGGTLDIDSSPGAGTRVTIRMPLKPCQG